MKTSVLGPGLTRAMALATGIAVANIYYNQPMLGVIERGFPQSTLAGMIPTATQLGYAAGLLFLLPLGDLMDRRRLIVGQFLALGLALAAVAAAPTALLLLIGSVGLGVAASVAQQIVPFAAALASPETRGRSIGTIMGGLLCGILLSRTLAGFVAGESGWRATFWLAVPINLGAALLMARLLPSHRSEQGLGYGEALRSLAAIWREEPVLRRSTYIQAALFGSFSAFWTILALHLEEPRFGLGPEVAGLFGIVGAVGVFAAPLAGRLADRRGPVQVIALGSGLAGLAWVLFGLWNSVTGLILGVILLDIGVQSALVSNQHRIYALRSTAQSRVNTLFMTVMFVGGSIGSAGATLAWGVGGWIGVSLHGAALAGIAMVLAARTGPR
jgi:predicted MFS family arabinose efflux permease